ncbi:MAG: hypothetical protein NVSMB16_02980 [Acidimicrobiales bacterium]
MEVLSSRVLLRPADLERSLAFYGSTLALPIYREFGGGEVRGVVFFLGGGFLEVSGRADGPCGDHVQLWLQVRDLLRCHEELVDALRGGLRACFPEGRCPQPSLARVPARQVF